MLYEPQPYQVPFHAASEPNVLALGTRGTGKSLQLRWDAIIRCLMWPNFRALLLRRSMPELRRSHLLDIEGEMAALGGTFHKTNNIAIFPNGSTIQFGHCEDDAIVLTYLSTQYGWVGFDELSTFAREQYLLIGASARATEASPYSAVVRAASNPLGPGASWMKEWFVDKSVDFGMFPDYNPADYKTIFSRLDENRYLDQQAYRARLSSLPPAVRKAWLEGEFAIEGQYFEFEPRRDGAEWHVTQDRPELQAWTLVYRAIDWGFSPDPACCLWIAVLPNGRATVIKERTWLRTTAAEVARQIRAESQGMRIAATFCDPTMFANSSATDLQSVGDIFESNGVGLTPSRNDRAAAGYAIQEWLHTLLDDGKPKLQMVARYCPQLVKTLPEMQIDKGNAAKIADGNDHWVIALAYGLMGIGTLTVSRESRKDHVPLYMKHRGTRTVLGNFNVKRRR